jgi:RNA polymerase sigma-70 factor, ECF subfamily
MAVTPAGAAGFLPPAKSREPIRIRGCIGEMAGVASSPKQNVPAFRRSITNEPEPDEQRLVTAARAGDRAAYGRLLARHQAVAFRAAHLITGSAAEAEEATQEAFVKAWLALGRFRSSAPFRPWLVRIAVNEARNRRRGTGRRSGLALRLRDDPAAATTAPSAEDQALAGEERAGLVAALGQLREDDQLVIAARYLLGLSETETATALGLRPGTVKSRLSRALDRLRAHLEHAG